MYIEMNIYFERHVDGDTVPLIKASESRRKMLQNETWEHGVEYYNRLKTIIKENNPLHETPLFIWGEHCSSCWKFEQLHVLSRLAKWSWELAKEKQPIEAKTYYQSAVSYCIQSIEILDGYKWIDSDIVSVQIMQLRYQLATALTYASEYYYNMYTFKENLPAIKKSYQMLELAKALWKKDLPIYDTIDMKKALCLHQLAHTLDDDKCGERVALLQIANELHSNEKILQDMNLWKQQNDSVYFNKVETDQSISLISLEDSFQNLLQISSQAECTG